MEGWCALHSRPSFPLHTPREELSVCPKNQPSMDSPDRFV